MKLTGYYMTAICKFERGVSGPAFQAVRFERTKFGAVVQSADIVDMDGVI